MKKKNVYILLIVITVLVIIVIWTSLNNETVKEIETIEGAVLDQEQGVVGGLAGGVQTPTIIPNEGDKSFSKGVGVPSGVTKNDEGYDYRSFVVVLRDGKLDPFEFRARLHDTIGISLENLDKEDRDVRISDVVDGQIGGPIKAGDTNFFYIRTIKTGTFDIHCPTCSDPVVGKIVIVNREEQAIEKVEEK